MTKKNFASWACSPTLLSLTSVALALCILTSFATPCYAQEDPPLAEMSTSVGDDWNWLLEQSVRSFNNFDHTHFGAATHMGARWKWLAFGIAASYRPINWSSNRREIPVPDGETYKGQTMVEVGQQFGFVGIYLSPSVAIKAVPGLEIDFPIIFGQGFLGTPLDGDDRITPNGERVSEIEDVLMEGQDIAFSLAIDAGVRARWFPFSTSAGETLGLGFAAGVHFTDFIGYEGNIYDASEIRSLGGSLSIIFSPR